MPFKVFHFISNSKAAHNDFPFFSRFVIGELELPSRLFETDCEPTGKKRVNNYFNLRWIEVIKSALEDEV
ncbi:hypothetical protein Bca4012_050370 [Brassica carinata]